MNRPRFMSVGSSVWLRFAGRWLSCGGACRMRRRGTRGDSDSRPALPAANRLAASRIGNRQDRATGQIRADHPDNVGWQSLALLKGTWEFIVASDERLEQGRRPVPKIPIPGTRKKASPMDWRGFGSSIGLADRRADQFFPPRAPYFSLSSRMALELSPASWSSDSISVTVSSSSTCSSMNHLSRLCVA